MHAQGGLRLILKPGADAGFYLLPVHAQGGLREGSPVQRAAMAPPAPFEGNNLIVRRCMHAEVDYPLANSRAKGGWFWGIVCRRPFTMIGAPGAVEVDVVVGWALRLLRALPLLL